MRNILNKLFKVKKKKKYRDVFYVKNYYINKQTVSYKLNFSRWEPADALKSQ